MCDKLYSKRSAFNYLEDLSQEFHKNYGRKVNTVTRPYAFIEFDVYIQKAKKNLTDRRRNINAINNQLQDVQRIMVSDQWPYPLFHRFHSIALYWFVLYSFVRWLAGTKHWRCTTAWHCPIRIRYENTEPVNVVAEIQKGRHLFEPQIDVCESSCCRNRFSCLHSVLLDSLISVQSSATPQSPHTNNKNYRDFSSRNFVSANKCEMQIRKQSVES